MALSTAYAEALAPVTRCMLEEAGIEPGQRVLELGSGGGDLAVAAGEATGLSGRVLATDVSLARMAGLVERVETSGQSTTIEILVSPAEELALGSGVFDVALARNCVMYFRNLGGAFARVRVALRHGGRFVASVYGPLEREPFHAIPIEAVVRRRIATEPAPEYVRAFGVDAASVQAAMLKAGFRDLRTRVVHVSRTYASLQAALDELRASPSLEDLLSVLPPGERDAAWTDIEDGFRRYSGAAGLRIPGEQVVIAGIA